MGALLSANNPDRPSRTPCQQWQSHISTIVMRTLLRGVDFQEISRIARQLRWPGHRKWVWRATGCIFRVVNKVNSSSDLTWQISPSDGCWSDGDSETRWPIAAHGLLTQALRGFILVGLCAQATAGTPLERRRFLILGRWKRR